MFLKNISSIFLGVIFILSMISLQAMHQEKKVYYFSHEQVLNCFKNLGELDLEAEWINYQDTLTIEAFEKYITDASVKFLNTIDFNKNLIFENELKTLFGEQNQENQQRPSICISLDHKYQSNDQIKSFIIGLALAMKEKIKLSDLSNKFPDISIDVEFSNEGYSYTILNNTIIDADSFKEEHWTSYDEYLSDVWKNSSRPAKDIMIVLSVVSAVVLTGLAIV